MGNRTEESPAGNNAAMREALEKVKNDLWDLMGTSSESARSNMACEMSRKIRSALAAPARNCDVGTAQEQYARWKAFCSENYNSAYAESGLNPCDDCPLVDCDANGNSSGCEFAWAQMPYGKGEPNE